MLDAFWDHFGFILELFWHHVAPLGGSGRGGAKGISILSNFGSHMEVKRAPKWSPNRPRTDPKVDEKIDLFSDRIWKRFWWILDGKMESNLKEKRSEAENKGEEAEARFCCYLQRICEILVTPGIDWSTKLH